MTPLPAAPCHFQAVSLPVGPSLSFLLDFFLVLCVHGQMGGKVGVADGKVRAEIWIFPKPGITVPGLTLQTGSSGLRFKVLGLSCHQCTCISFGVCPHPAPDLA